VGWIDCGSQVATFRQTVRHSFYGIDEYEVVKRPFDKQVESIAQRYFIAQGDAGFSYNGVSARKHLNTWSLSTFFFRTSGGFSVSTSINNDSIHEEYVSPGEGLQTIKNYRKGTHSISYCLSDISPNTYLYGVALESESGVVVDNFSMRGSSGVSLKDMPRKVLSEFASVRPYDLIIIHFGLNVVNEKSHAANYKAYTSQMGKAIEHLRESFPEASILVVSMPDRDQRTAAGIRTMLGVESLVAYQQIMAAEHHTAFFNLFEAMGGRESMKALVDQGLANKDYTHLTIAGGRRLGTLIVNYLNSGYDRYKSIHQ
jgi:lysophospholipase L1-like esterase